MKKERGSVVAMTEVFFAAGGVLACLVQLALQARALLAAAARRGAHS